MSESSSLTSAVTDEKTEAHGVELLCPRSHSKPVAELGEDADLIPRRPEATLPLRKMMAQPSAQLLSEADPQVWTLPGLFSPSRWHGISRVHVA